MKDSKNRTVNKANLPQKLCPACRRLFSWRKKWARDWEQVIYCSDKCRAAGKMLGESNYTR